MLSGDLAPNNRSKLHSTQQKILFPETTQDAIWEKSDLVKRYHLSFPFFPFRTLCPRDLNQMLASTKDLHPSIDPTSPIFPANTQLNITFHKRNITNFLPYMLPYNIISDVGSHNNKLTNAQLTTILTFNTNWVVKSVSIDVKDMYLQVRVNKSVF